MTSIFKLLTVSFALAAIGTQFCGDHLGLMYLWQICAALDELIRIVLLSGMAGVLLRAFVITGAMKSGGDAAYKSQLSKAKLGPYVSLVEPCQPVFAFAYRPAQLAIVEASTGRAAVDADMQITAAGPVLSAGRAKTRRSLNL